MDKQIIEIMRTPETKPIDMETLGSLIRNIRRDTEWEVRETTSPSADSSRIMLKKGTHVKTIGPPGGSVGKTGIIKSVSEKARREGLLCYRVLWDGQTSKVTRSISADFLEEIHSNTIYEDVSQQADLAGPEKPGC